VLEMINSLLCHKDEINEVTSCVLMSLDWNVLSQVCKLLDAFETLTDVASGPFVDLSIVPSSGRTVLNLPLLRRKLLVKT
jgi:hypothetical protein